MAKHRTDQLDGTRLAIAVALAEGLPFYDMDTNWPGNAAVCEAVRERGAVVIRNLIGEVLIERAIGQGEDWAPHVHWSQGGPIIEREHISISPPESLVHRNGGPNAGWGEVGMWTASSWKLRKADGGRSIADHYTSPLIAAMRLLVRCKLGDEVELPDATGGAHG